MTTIQQPKLSIADPKVNQFRENLISNEKSANTGRQVSGPTPDSWQQWSRRQPGGIDAGRRQPSVNPQLPTQGVQPIERYSSPAADRARSLIENPDLKLGLSQQPGVSGPKHSSTTPRQPKAPTSTLRTPPSNLGASATLLGVGTAVAIPAVVDSVSSGAARGATGALNIAESLAQGKGVIEAIGGAIALDMRMKMRQQEADRRALGLEPSAWAEQIASPDPFLDLIKDLQDKPRQSQPKPKPTGPKQPSSQQPSPKPSPKPSPRPSPKPSPEPSPRPSPKPSPPSPQEESTRKSARQPYRPQPLEPIDLRQDFKELQDNPKNLKLPPKENQPLTPGENGKVGGVNLTTPTNKVVNEINQKLTNFNKEINQKVDQVNNKIKETNENIKKAEEKITENNEANRKKIQDELDKIPKLIENLKNQVTQELKKIHSDLTNYLSGYLLPILEQLGRLNTDLINLNLGNLQQNVTSQLGNIQKNINDQFTNLDANMAAGLLAIPAGVAIAMKPIMKNHTGLMINHSTNLARATNSNIQLAQATGIDTTIESARASGKHKCKPRDKKIDGILIPDPNKPRKNPTPENNWRKETPTIAIKYSTDSEALDYLVEAVARLENVLPIAQQKFSNLDRNLIFPNAKGNDNPIDLFAFIEYIYRAIDNVIGAPRKFQIADADPMTSGSQEQSVEPANLFALIEGIYKFSFDASRDIDLTTAVGTRSMLMSANLMKLLAEVHTMCNAIIEDLDFEIGETLGQLNLPCDPYAGKGVFNNTKNFTFTPDKRFESTEEKDVEDLAASMLKPARIPVKKYSKKDVTSLRDTLAGISRFAAVAASANAIKSNDLEKNLEAKQIQEEVETTLFVARSRLAKGHGPIKKRPKPVGFGDIK